MPASATMSGIRKGYFDFENKPTDEKTRKTEINDAVLSPLDSSALGIACGHGPRRQASAELDGAEVGSGSEGNRLGAKGDLMAAKLDVFMVQKNDRGNTFNGTQLTIDLALTKDQLNKVMKTAGLILPFGDNRSTERTVPLVAQATQLRIVVRDFASGTLGSVTVPLKAAAASRPALIKR